MKNAESRSIEFPFNRVLVFKVTTRSSNNCSLDDPVPFDIKFND